MAAAPPNASLFDAQPPPTELCFARPLCYRPDAAATGVQPAPPASPPSLPCAHLKPGEPRTGCRPQLQDPAAVANASSCFVATLALLHRESCMIRQRLAERPGATANRTGPGGSVKLAPGVTYPPIPTRQLKGLALLPFYVLNTPWLTKRRALMEESLRLAGASDVTWVHCANGPDLHCLSQHQRFCLHPTFLQCVWHDRPLTDGTLSLVLKHKLAFFDMLRRGASGAIVLEDDARLRPDMLTLLSGYLMPADAELFFLGSYSAWRQNSLQDPAHPFSCRCRALVQGTSLQRALTTGRWSVCPLIRRAWMAPAGFRTLDILGSSPEPLAGPAPPFTFASRAESPVALRVPQARRR